MEHQLIAERLQDLLKSDGMAVTRELETLLLQFDVLLQSFQGSVAPELALQANEIIENERLRFAKAAQYIRNL